MGIFKKRRVSASIKTKTVIYTSVFAALLLAVVWIFQVVLLDFFYEKAVNREIIETAETAGKNIDEENISELTESLSERTQTDIKIVFANGSTEEYIQSVSHGSILNNNGIVKYYIDMANESGGEYFSRHIETVKTPAKDKKPPFDTPPEDKGGKKQFDTLYESESLIYCLRTQRETGENAYIIVSCELTPVDATVETIKSQLNVISILFIIIAALMGAFIAGKLSSPIISINRSAKKLAHGNYCADFEGDGFKETKELADTLNYAAEELSKVDGLRREFIANVSHDLKTPLTMIRGYGELVRDIPGENTPENIQIIIDEAEHLHALVDDILSISKTESGMDTLNIAPCDITQLISDIVSRYSKMKGADGYRINFRYNEHIRLDLDSLKISQVIYNLINNAINYSGDDKSVTVVQKQTARGVRIEVIDTGCGISEENIKYIWDRYYKENKAHKRAQVGTGLGLSIVKGIIELHGGKYGVISRENAGSVFWFELENGYE